MRATINGASIFYDDQGHREGLPVIFVHGFPFSRAMWNGQVDATGTFCRVVTYDVRGLGESEVGDGQYTIEGHVDDLIGLLDHLGIGKTAIVGLSMGGYITLRAIERNPERFVAAILCDTRSEADGNDTKIKRALGIKSVKQGGSRLFADTFVKGVFAEESFERNPEAVRFIHGIIERTSPLSIAGTLLALASRTDTTEALSRIAVPTLILVGEHDVTTPPSASRAMHERIRHSELYIIPGAAHMSNLENPAVFNEKVVGFLQRITAAG
jgi:pimeloyl-ACP methyl ester carboxylesterase